MQFRAVGITSDLADLLTLFQPGWQIMPTTLLLLHRDFKSFLRSCNLMQLQKKGLRLTVHCTLNNFDLIKNVSIFKQT